MNAFAGYEWAMFWAGIAVFVCVLIGAWIGIMAAHRDHPNRSWRRLPWEGCAFAIFLGALVAGCFMWAAFGSAHARSQDFAAVHSVHLNNPEVVHILKLSRRDGTVGYVNTAKEYCSTTILQDNFDQWRVIHDPHIEQCVKNVR